MVQSKVSGGFLSVLFIPLYSLCRKRLYVVQSAHDKDEGKLTPRQRKTNKKKKPVHQKQVQRPALCTFLQRKKKVFTPVQRSRPVSAFTRRHLLFHADWILLALKHTWQVHVCLYTLIHTVHGLWQLEGGVRRTEWTAGQCKLWQIQVHKIRGNEIWRHARSGVLNIHDLSPRKKSSLERSGAATSFIVVFGTLLLCPSRISLSNPWQTWIQIHLSTYKDLCSLTSRASDGDILTPSNCQLTHTHSPL